MRAPARVLLSALLAAAAAGHARASEEDILAASAAAAGGAAWLKPGTLDLDYAYAGQGLTGTTHTRYDLSGRGFIDSYVTGPQAGASGFDGTNAWEKEPSGIVSDQKGGDTLPLAVNEAYRDGNLWWRGDLGGASIVGKGRTTEKNESFGVLTVTPKDGKHFDAWFDVKTHLLARTVEVQASQTITTFFSDYAPVGGRAIAHTIVIDDGSGAANRQTETLSAARVLPVESPANFAQPQSVLHDTSIAGNAAETTVPFRLINNHIFADVSVNGGKPLLFIFDTGGHSLLTSETSKDLRIAAKGAETMTGGGSGFVQGGITRVASLTVGDATITDQPVTVADFGSTATEGIDVKGMVGYEFFARFITRFDYGAHTITFIDKMHFDRRDAGTAVPMVLYNQLPQVAGSYDGIPALFCIDTGSRMPLLLTGPFVAAHGLRMQAANGVEAMTGWGIGGPSRSFVTRGGELKLGDVTIDHPLTMMSLDTGGSAAAEAFPNNVGGGVLKRFVVTLDYDHYVMYLKPVAPPVADLDTFDRSGIWINGDADGFKIVEVSKGTPAEAAGLKAGDIIVTVDGKPASAIALYDLRQRLRNDAPGTVVKFSLKGRAKDVAVTLRDLVQARTPADQKA